MPTNPTPDEPQRANVLQTAKLIGRSRDSVYKYIRQTEGMDPHPLGLQRTPTGATLDVEKTRAWAMSRRPGPPVRKGQSA